MANTHVRAPDDRARDSIAEGADMCMNDTGRLQFETMADDPLTRMVMDSDSVTPAAFMTLIARTRSAVAANRSRETSISSKVETIPHGV
jgi:hypothetical protein